MDRKQPDELLALYVAMSRADSAPMRRIAVWELGRLRDPRGAPHLLRAIVEDPDWECRHYAIMALANVGGPQDARLLRELAAGDYLSTDGRCPAGPLPDNLAEHLAEDLEHSARCCTGETPRPYEAPDEHGDWWQGNGP